MQYNCYFLFYHMMADDNLVQNSSAHVAGLFLSLTQHSHTSSCDFFAFFLNFLHSSICCCSDIILNVVKPCHIGAFFIWTKPNKLLKHGIDNFTVLHVRRDWHFCILQMIFYRTAGERVLNLLVNSGRFFQKLFEMWFKMEMILQGMQHFGWYFSNSFFLVRNCDTC